MWALHSPPHTVSGVSGWVPRCIFELVGHQGTQAGLCGVLVETLNYVLVPLSTVQGSRGHLAGPMGLGFPPSGGQLMQWVGAKSACHAVVSPVCTLWEGPTLGGGPLAAGPLLLVLPSLGNLGTCVG